MPNGKVIVLGACDEGADARACRVDLSAESTRPPLRAGWRICVEPVVASQAPFTAIRLPKWISGRNPRTDHRRHASSMGNLKRENLNLSAGDGRLTRCLVPVPGFIGSVFCRIPVLLDMHLEEMRHAPHRHINRYPANKPAECAVRLSVSSALPLLLNFERLPDSVI